MSNTTAPRVYTRSEWSGELCRRLQRHVAAVAPAGLGYWPPAWEQVEGPSSKLLDTLLDFEAHGSEEAKHAAVQQAGEVLLAWRAAAAEWERAGRPRTPEEVFERWSIQSEPAL